MLRIGIVGLGVISGVHLEAIRQIEPAKLTAVCDIVASKKEKAPEARFYTDVEEMLKNEKLDCLHICLPHHLHVPVILLAAKYHVNVFVEKPIGLNEKDIESIKDIETNYPIKVGTCLQNRYNETTIKIKELLQDNTYGELKGCKAIVTWNRSQNYYDQDPWRGTLGEAGGGVMLSQAIHTLDLMYLLCGPAKWIKGFGGNLLLEEIEVEDTACAHMEFETGASGIFYGTVTHCHNSSIEVEIVCEKAILTIKDGKLTLHQNKEEIILAEDAVAANKKDYYGNSHHSAIRAFYQAILTNSKEYINVEESTWSVRIAESVIESAKFNKRVYF